MPNWEPVSAYVRYAPRVKTAPCAKLMMRRIEKTSVKPRAKIEYTLPMASPLRNCWTSSVRRHRAREEATTSRPSAASGVPVVTGVSTGRRRRPPGPTS